MKRSVRITSLFLSLSIVISIAACTKKDESTSSTTEQTTLSETTVSESTTVPTNTPTSVPTNTPTPSPEPTPTPVPTDTPTPVPTATPTPKPTKAPKPTQAPTETTAKPTEPTEPSKPSESTFPEPTEPPTPTTDSNGRDYEAEQKAGVQCLKELGYTVTKVGDAKSEYGICFENATGTFKGTAYIMSSTQWSISYRSVNDDDPNATYRFSKRGIDIVGLFNSIDPSWLNYTA